ncbi:hypothetical protein QUB36_29850 [Microcoleus sp. AT8-B1]|uniref:hypothetical protein n=1 Tax=unclassified Microcoleus TaxID=2642155 RepID=UPI002FD05F3E
MTRQPNIPTTAALRLTGTKSEIELVLAVLRGKDFFWKTNGKFYPQRGDGNQYAYYLNELQLPQLGGAVPSTPGEPQPRPWDAVLGGQGTEKSVRNFGQESL